MHSPLKLCVLNDDGKTFSQVLARKYHLVLVSADGLAQEQIQKNSPMGKMIQQEASKESVLKDLVQFRVNRKDCTI